MSYYQSGQYQQPPADQPPYNDPYNQYPPAQNGGYQNSYVQQPSYSAQSQHDQYQGGGGPVQQPTQGEYQDGYQSPRSTSFGGGYSSPQYQQPQQQSYNPAQYATQQSPQPAYQSIPQYDPRAYAQPNTSPYPQQYNPAAFPEPTTSTGGPLSANPYGYSPGTSAYSLQPPHSAYASSPPIHQSQFAQAPSYSQPPPPSNEYGYQQPPPLPQRSHTEHGRYQPSYGSPQPPSAPYPQEGYHRPHAQSISAMPVPPQHHPSVSPALPGLSGEQWVPSPPQHQADVTRQSPSPLYPSTSHGSLPSPPSSTPGPTPPAHGSGSYVSRSDTLNRHPHQRPLPGPPEPDAGSDYFRRIRSNTRLTHAEAEALSQEELFSQVENAVMNAGGGSSSGGHSPVINLSQPAHNAQAQPTPLFASGSTSVRRNGSVVNGHLSPIPVDHNHSDDSDLEASQGLAMMRMEEEADARRQSVSSQPRFSGYGSVRHSRSQRQQTAGGASDSDDYGAVDMSSFGGGFDVHMSYGGDPNQPAAGHEQNGAAYNGTPAASSQHSSMRRSHASQSSQLSQASGYNYTMDSIHPFPPFNPAAQVDMSGTGGLAEPASIGRRQSYDEGDEYTLMEGQLPERFPDEPPDITGMFQTASATYNQNQSHRPLPAVPGFGEPPPPLLNTDVRGYLPPGPDAYMYNSQGQYVPRSTSLISHQTAPQIIQPLRSKTDAEERRLRSQGNRSSAQTPSFESAPGAIPLDLPTIGAKRFLPSKLGAPDFKKCDQPWALSSLLEWLLNTVAPEQYAELKEAEVKEALVALFTNKVPTMNIADAEGLSEHVVSNMYAAGTLVSTEEWVKLVPAQMSGVIYQLTRAGCYSPTLHDHLVPGRCYARHCQRTLRKVNLQTHFVRSKADWAEHYALDKSVCETHDKKMIQLQNQLHEVVYTEEGYMEELRVLGSLYRDQLATIEPSIITPRRKEKFLRDVFGRVEAVLRANEDHLLPQLKYRQLEQGPWIVGFSDVFRQWIRKARTAYLDYAGGFPGANFLVRQELDRNIEFRAFVDKVTKEKRSGRLSWDNFLKAPITRLPRYGLMLSTIIKTMKVDSQERVNLQAALDEVKEVTKECDARVADMQRKVDLSDLSMKLVLRPGMQGQVELNLDHFGRELIHRGDLQRMGGNRFTWLDAHAILFDHYLVLAKTVSQRSDQGGKLEKYDVSRLPIPMDLLILETTNDPAVQKSTYVKGITSVSAASGRDTTSSALGRTPSNQTGAQPSLQHANTGASGNTLQTVTSLGDGKDERIMWPFKIKHLGRETYTLFAPSETARREWTTKIIEAKTKHASSIHSQHAEPFRLRVMADSAFVYDAFGSTGPSKSVTIKGTPVDRAIKDVEMRYKDTGRPGPICRARVNCATAFTTGYTQGAQGSKRMVAVGTDFGVYVCEMQNPRGWSRAISLSRVTQISVLEEFNLLLLISDKSLIAYHLDLVCPSTVSGPNPGTNDSTRKAPQKLSGSKDVGFFVAGRMKDRQLVFYKKRENLASVFKVLEPIYQKSTEKKRGIFKRGTTEFFREYDEFYIPAECTGTNLFHSSLAVSTARGFEVLTLDKKQPWTVPELKSPAVQNIAAHIKEQRALGMLRLSEQEFLLCYTNCAVYVNKHGEVSRSVIMDFVGSAQTAALAGAYLVLFDSDFVEIRNAQNGRLKQIIAGREIKCLDDGASDLSAAGGAGGEERTVKFVMQHPESEKTQLVVELVLNQDMKEAS